MPQPAASEHSERPVHWSRSSSALTDSAVTRERGRTRSTWAEPGPGSWAPPRPHPRGMGGRARGVPPARLAQGAYLNMAMRRLSSKMLVKRR